MSTAMNLGLGLSVIVGFGALALDLGYANFARTQTQAAADAAAIAGAISLQIDDSDSAGMVAQAQTWGESNMAGTTPILVDESDVRRGTLAIGAECSSFVDTATGNDVYARAYTTGTPAFLSRIWGNADSDTEACAVARVLPPSVCTMIGLGDAGVNGQSNLLVGYDSEVDPDPANSPNEDAAVCSNADITLHGAPQIEGSVRPGIGGEIDGSTENVTGTTEPLGEDLDYPSPDFAAIAADFPNGRKPWPLPYNLQGNNVYNLPPGAWVLSNNLKVGGQVKINVSNSPTMILSSGYDVDLGGGGVVFPAGADTHNFSIYASGDAEIKIGGTSAFYGFVYAPGGEVSLNGNAAFYGAVVSSGLEINGGGNKALYMDVSLMEDEQEGGVRLIR